ncbi:MAG: hypothetical protein ACO3G9_08785, partial [Chthoniobacterales bacterium]
REPPEPRAWEAWEPQRRASAAWVRQRELPELRAREAWEPQRRASAAWVRRWAQQPQRVSAAAVQLAPAH